MNEELFAAYGRGFAAGWRQRDDWHMREAARAKAEADQAGKAFDAHFPSIASYTPTPQPDDGRARAEVLCDEYEVVIERATRVRAEAEAILSEHIAKKRAKADAEAKSHMPPGSVLLAGGAEFVEKLAKRRRDAMAGAVPPQPGRVWWGRRR